jgi:hypothetical protein
VWRGRQQPDYILQAANPGTGVSIAAATLLYIACSGRCHQVINKKTGLTEAEMIEDADDEETSKKWIDMPTMNKQTKSRLIADDEWANKKSQTI